MASEGREGGEVKVEGSGSSSEAEPVAVNGLPDLEHISFSYSSDEDFLPTHMKQHETADLKPYRAGEKPDAKPSSHEAMRHSPPPAKPGRQLGSNVALDLGAGHAPLPDPDRDKRKADPLSLAQRRRRLCSIARKMPQPASPASIATPTALATPSSLTSHKESASSSRQPISPGPRTSTAATAHRPAHRPAHSIHSSSDSEMETAPSIPNNHHARSRSPQLPFQELPSKPEGVQDAVEARWAGGWSSNSRDSSDSEGWEPGLWRKKNAKKKTQEKGAREKRRHKKGQPQEREERMGERDREGEKGREEEGKVRTKRKNPKKSRPDGRHHHHHHGNRKHDRKEALPARKPHRTPSPVQVDWPVSREDSESSDDGEGLSAIIAMVAQGSAKLKQVEGSQDKSRVADKDTGRTKSCDDERVLEELKRKVRAEEVAEQLKLKPHGQSLVPSEADAKLQSLEEELAISTSSESEADEDRPESQASNRRENAGRGEVHRGESAAPRSKDSAEVSEGKACSPAEEVGEEEVQVTGRGVGGKARAKRLLSSDSDSDMDTHSSRGQERKEPNPQDLSRPKEHSQTGGTSRQDSGRDANGGTSKQDSGRDANGGTSKQDGGRDANGSTSKQDSGRAANGKDVGRGPTKEGIRKRTPETAQSSPAKKLRLIDIDFTGGRMRQSLLPPQRPFRPKTHPHGLASRHSSGPGGDRKLKQVTANASNVLKSPRPVKPAPIPLHSPHPSRPVQHSHTPSKRPAHDGKRDPLAHKDAVLAAKFPQKRKLLEDSAPSQLRGHKSSKPKPPHRHS